MDRRSAKRWTEAEDGIIRDLYPENDFGALSGHLPGRTSSSIGHRAYVLGVKKSTRYMRDLGAAHMQAGIERFGRECWEKPLGSLRHEKTRVLIKLGQPDIWKPLHIHAWELANGPVPGGQLVAARDGNRKNISMENLCLRTLSEHCVWNSPDYRDLPEEIIDIVHLQNELKKEIKRKTKHEK